MSKGFRQTDRQNNNRKFQKLSFQFLAKSKRKGKTSSIKCEETLATIQYLEINYPRRITLEAKAHSEGEEDEVAAMLRQNMVIKHKKKKDKNKGESFKLQNTLSRSLHRITTSKTHNKFRKSYVKDDGKYPLQLADKSRYRHDMLYTLTCSVDYIQITICAVCCC